jgi:hypothetical protein
MWCGVCIIADHRSSRAVSEGRMPEEQSHDEEALGLLLLQLTDDKPIIRISFSSPSLALGRSIGRVTGVFIESH